MDPLINILTNLYGESFHKDFEEHLALLKEINNYRRRNRAKIERESIMAFNYIISYNHLMFEENDKFDSDVYWSYSEWFKEVFIEDYNKALIEVEQQSIPSDRELCIRRLAREAKYKNIPFKTMYKFCWEYLDSNEYIIFWIEYNTTNNYE